MNTPKDDSATIKPKAEDTGYHEHFKDFTTDMSKRLSKKIINQNNPAPTRKLVTQELIEWIMRLESHPLAFLPVEPEARFIALMKEKIQSEFKAKEIENLKQTYHDGKWEGNYIAVKGQKGSQDYITQTYNQ